MRTERNPHTKPWAKKKMDFCVGNSFFLILAPRLYCAVKQAITWQQLGGAEAQHLVVSYSGPSVAADCTVSQPGGPPSMTLASHSRVNQEPAIIQWACGELHSNWKLL